MALSRAVRIAVCVIFALAFAQALLPLIGLVLPLGVFAPEVYALLVALCFWLLWRVYRP